MSNRMPTRDEIEESARLILMDNPSGPMEFTKKLRNEFYQTQISLEACMDLWGKYRGHDGRSKPTHDVETGEPL